MLEYCTKEELCQKWIEAKTIEKEAVDLRRQVEDRLALLYGISDADEGSKTLHDNGFVIKHTARINRSVDGEKLQQLARDAGLADHLSTLFRWKPELNSKAWQAAAPEITLPLADAITAKPGRISFAIQEEKE